MNIRETTRPLYAKQVSDTAGIEEKPYSAGIFLLFVFLNVILVYFSKENRMFSTLYGLSVLALGMIFLAVDKKPLRLVYLCGYIVGAELIWRSTNARIFYEYGKYAIVFLLILAILKFGLLKQATKWPVVYFVLLIPSIFLLPNLDRDPISFFLSGPLLLAVATMFFSTVRLTQVQLRKLLVAIIVPTIGIAFLATYNTVTATELVFTTESNFITSGGFGPVQISLQLAFGALLAFYYAIMEKKDHMMILLMFSVTIWLMAQSIFTFSRSGVYNSGLTLLVFFLFYLRHNSQRIRIVIIGALLVLFLASVVFPWMDQFTNGMLARRYMETTASGRGILVRADWQAFLENPILGIGPGQSIFYHAQFGIWASSHTEYTRLLAEHGSLGLLAMLILIIFAMKRVFSKTSSSGKSFQILVTVWAMLYMLNTTMRTASPGFAFGLGAAMLLLEEKSVVDEAQNTLGRQFPGRLSKSGSR